MSKKTKAPVATPIAAAVGISQPVGVAANIEAPKMGVSFSSLDSKTRAEKGVACPIRNEFGDEIGLSIVVHGNDSDKFRRAAVQRRREINDAIEMFKEDREAIAMATIDADIRLLARCTSEFIGLVDDEGEAIACTEKTAIDLYKHAGDVREQVDMFLGNRRNFMKA